MAKRPSTTPMECQRYNHGDAQPMAPAPTERPQTPRMLARAMAEEGAETLRNRSLKAQRAQISGHRSKD